MNVSQSLSCLLAAYRRRLTCTRTLSNLAIFPSSDRGGPEALGSRITEYVGHMAAVVANLAAILAVYFQGQNVVVAASSTVYCL